MAVPLHQTIRVGAYVLGRHLRGVRRYPLVLMLEPLFRCNLACAGCGKIDYPDAILNQRLSVDECLEAVEECGAPVVVLAGGEPLLHRDIDQIAAHVKADEHRIRLQTLSLRAGEIATDVHNLSYELHPAKRQTRDSPPR